MGVRADAFNGPAHAADACLVRDCPRADVHDVCGAPVVAMRRLAVVMSCAVRCVSMRLVLRPQCSYGDS